MIDTIPDTVSKAIVDSLRRGNDVEVKKINGQIVVVEIKRKVKIKTSV